MMSSSTSTLPQGEGGQPGEWVYLNSKSISSVAFVKEQNLLKVHFKDGDTWAYKDVPKSKYKFLVYANSSGAYLKNEIIPHHEAVKLHDGPPEELNGVGV
jgi:hypothetical protein